MAFLLIVFLVSSWELIVFWWIHELKKINNVGEKCLPMFNKSFMIETSIEMNCGKVIKTVHILLYIYFFVFQTSFAKVLMTSIRYAVELNCSRIRHRHEVQLKLSTVYFFQFGKLQSTEPCPDKTVPEETVPNCKIFSNKTFPDKIVPRKQTE